MNYYKSEADGEKPAWQKMKAAWIEHHWSQAAIMPLSFCL
jgi:hypothetical protein